jgi:hypothetical protein
VPVALGGLLMRFVLQQLNVLMWLIACPQALAGAAAGIVAAA